MAQTVSTWAAWRRQQLLRLSSKESAGLLAEWLAGLFLLVEALGLLAFASSLSSLSRGLLILLWTQWLLTLIGLRAAGLLQMFGPVLYYDLVCTARRRRFLFARIAYGFLLWVLLCWVYLMWLLDAPYGTIDARQMSAFASSFFYTFMIVQGTTVLLLTPAYTAGTIADEKERRTLEFMLGTDLRNREIVLSKLASRLAHLTFLILTGLPILSLLQFLGGVDPNLTLASFVASGMTMASLGSLGIFCSVHMRKPRDAIALTYVGATAYLIISGFAAGMMPLLPIAGWTITPLSWSWSISLTDLADWFASGNIFWQLIKLSRGGGAPVDELLPQMVRRYVIFHGTVALVLSLWATVRVRAVALRESYGAVKKQPLLTRLFGRPKPGHWPMLWKEIFAEPGMRFNWIGRAIVAILFLASFLPVPFIVYAFLGAFFGWDGFGPRYRNDAWEMLNQGMNVWVRIVGTMVACLTLLAVAVRAASSISGERDRRTLDELLTSPLTCGAMVFAKWLGSVLSVRWAWLWLALMAAMAVVTGGMNPLAVPLLFVTWTIYASAAAMIGLACSIHCRTSMRSMIWTLIIIVMISGGHWVLAVLFIYMPLSLMSMGGPGNHDLVQWIARLEYGQTPPLVLGTFAFFSGDFQYNHPDTPKLVACCVFGVFCGIPIAVGLGVLNTLRFTQLTNRWPWRRPPLPPRSDSPSRPVPVRARNASPLVLDALPADGNGNGDGAAILDAVAVPEEPATGEPPAATA
jgi:ABC-type transport system involved in multi-copper enzyme maturation permease subunit